MNDNTLQQIVNTLSDISRKVDDNSRSVEKIHSSLNTIYDKLNEIGRNSGIEKQDVRTSLSIITRKLSDIESKLNQR